MKKGSRERNIGGGGVGRGWREVEGDKRTDISVNVR